MQSISTIVIFSFPLYHDDRMPNNNNLGKYSIPNQYYSMVTFSQASTIAIWYNFVIMWNFRINQLVSHITDNIQYQLIEFANSDFCAFWHSALKFPKKKVMIELFGALELNDTPDIRHL